MLTDALEHPATQDAHLRVTIVSGSLPEMPCGVGDYTRRLAAALASEGTAVHIVTSRDDRIAPIAHVAVDREVAGWGVLRIPQLLRLIRRSLPDVVHVEYPTVGYQHGLAPLLLLPVLRLSARRTRLVVTLHEYRHAARLHRLYMAALVPWAHALVTPDASQMHGLPFRTAVRRIEIPLASNIEPTQDPVQKDGSDLVVGTWGFLRPDKGIDRLIEVFPDIVAARPARLVIAGDPGPDEQHAEKVRALAATSPVADRITFTGRLSEGGLSQALTNFDVCVLPYASGLEPNRGTYLAARAHGLSIVTTTVGEAGFDEATDTTLVRVGDREGLIGAVLERGRPSSSQVDEHLGRMAVHRCTAPGHLPARPGPFTLQAQTAIVHRRAAYR